MVLHAGGSQAGPCGRLASVSELVSPQPCVLARGSETGRLPYSRRRRQGAERGAGPAGVFPRGHRRLEGRREQSRPRGQVMAPLRSARTQVGGGGSLAALVGGEPALPVLQ